MFSKRQGKADACGLVDPDGPKEVLLKHAKFIASIWCIPEQQLDGGGLKLQPQGRGTVRAACSHTAVKLMYLESLNSTPAAESLSKVWQPRVHQLELAVLKTDVSH